MLRGILREHPGKCAVEYTGEFSGEAVTCPVSPLSSFLRAASSVRCPPSAPCPMSTFTCPLPLSSVLCPLSFAPSLYPLSPVLMSTCPASCPELLQAGQKMVCASRTALLNRAHCTNSGFRSARPPRSCPFCLPYLARAHCSSKRLRVSSLP